MRIFTLCLFLCFGFLQTDLALAQATGQPGPRQQGSVSDNTGDRSDRGDGALDEARRSRRSDAVYIAGNRLEYIVIGPPGQSNTVIQALTGAGAVLRRSREYPSLNRRGLIFDFRNALTLPQAERLLAQVAPLSYVDTHAYYRFAQAGPRLYAPEMVGVAVPGACRLSGSVAVGLIDGPVDSSHPALRSVQVTNESVLTRGERPPNTAHGTAVAVIMAGQDGGGPLMGLAGGARLHAVSAFTRDRGREAGDIERIAAALDRLISQNVRLINMSFAGPENRAMDRVLDAAAQRGAVMIAAAGNNGRALAAYPAAHPDVIAVTAIDAGYRRYRRANFGDHIEFAAPGVDIFVATRRGGASYASGTSYAAPIITALAARLAPGAPVDTVRERLRAASVDLGNPGRDAEFGWGLVRAGGC